MRLLEEMVRTVRNEMALAVVSYEEKPREVWVYDPPAQVALCVCQIWWAIEVAVTFQRLEEGYENALKDFNKKQVSTSSVFQLQYYYFFLFRSLSKFNWTSSKFNGTL